MKLKSVDGQYKINRTISSGNIGEYVSAALNSRNYAKDKPIHKQSESLLSNESGFTNFRGLINWGLITLLIFGGRSALENYNKNGLIFDPLIWRCFLQGDQKQGVGLFFIAISNMFILIGLYAEVLMTFKSFPEILGWFIICSNLLGCIIFPTVVVLAHNWNPFFTCPAMMMYVIIFLKLWSYAMVNHWCRASQKRFENNVVNLGFKKASNNKKRRRNKKEENVDTRKLSYQSMTDTPNLDVDSLCLDKDKPEVYRDDKTKIKLSLLTKYPENLTLRNMYYFMVVPTLCYELNFPKTFGIRKRFLFKRLFELVVLTQVLFCLVQQWMVPALKSSMTPFYRSHWTYTMERLLNIAIPNHVLWLLGFYTVFHSFLNVIAELLCFGDRCFYLDWWNADSIFGFWSTWNIPVHRWCSRHLYKPLLSMGISRVVAGTTVFIVSAFLHEYLVSIPLKMFRMWAFFGMLAQQPYALLVYKWCPEGGKLGNMAMWLTLIIGQPLAVYMYFHDFYLQYYSVTMK